jgi:hypothetical protein
MSRGSVGAFTLAALVAVAPAALAETPSGGVPSPAASSERLRRELQILESLLDRAVGQASPPNPGFVLAGAPSTRGYRLHGQGIVFVLPPRRLPMADMVLARPGRQVVIRRTGRGSGSDLQQLELQVREFQRQVAQEWESMEQSFLEIHQRVNNPNPGATPVVAAQPSIVHPSGPEPVLPLLPRAAASAPAPAPAPGPSAPAAPEPPATPAPPAPPSPPRLPSWEQSPLAPVVPPWHVWSEEFVHEGDARPPHQVVADTRDALLSVLADHGHLLSSVPAEETVSVVVDFVSGTPILDDNARAERSLALRVRKADLEECRAGRLAREELRRRIEITEY